jgi:hypothetical protein
LLRSHSSIFKWTARKHFPPHIWIIGGQISLEGVAISVIIRTDEGLIVVVYIGVYTPSTYMIFATLDGVDDGGG